MPVILSMSLVVLIWSLYPLAASIGLETMGSMEMLLIVLVISSIGALFLSFLYLWRYGLINKTISIQKTLPRQAYLMALLSGVSGVFCHVFLFWSLSLSNKGGVALLYDSWPIIAIIATPMLMKKTWKEVSFVQFVVSLIAFVGVAIIILSDKSIDMNLNNLSLNKDLDFKVLGGYIMAFVGGYMVALVAVSQGAFSEYFNELENNFASTLIGQVCGRTISLIIATVLYAFFAEPYSELTINWLPTLFIGIGVMVFGGALYTYSLLKSNNPTVNIMYYFVPVFAVIWLWLAGESTVNLGLFIGGSIILISNIYLFIAGRKAPLSEKL